MNKTEKCHFLESHKLVLLWEKCTLEQKEVLLKSPVSKPIKRVLEYCEQAVYFTKEGLHNFLGVSFTDGYVRNLMSDASVVIENYWLQMYLEEDKLLRERLLTELYHQKKIPSLVTKQYSKQERLVHHTHQQVSLEAYLLEEQYFRLVCLQNRDQEPNIESILDHLDAFYLQEKLYWGLQIASYTTLSNKSYSMRLWDELQDLKQSLPHNPSIELYTLAVAVLKEGSLEHYSNLESYFKEHQSKLASSVIKTVLLILINYGLKRMNRGDKLFEETTFEWYQFGIERGVLIDQGQISPFTYKNVLILALKLKKYDWAGHYIDALKPYLEEKYQDSYSNYCKAKLYFETQDYKNAMKHLYNVEYEDQIFSLNAKTMLLKIYYERGDFDALESLLGSFKNYIKRKEISPFYKTNFTHLIQLTIKLMNTSSEKQLLKLQHLIENTQPLTEKEWLLQKVKERY